MAKKCILGLDMGGTNLRGGLVADHSLLQISYERINSLGSLDEVLDNLFAFTDRMINTSVQAIGIGVPGLVDASEKMVYDVVYIPSWKKIPLQKLMEERYQIPVHVNNDANCFALGEFYFGKGVGFNSMIGLTIGTGLGSGIILQQQLYEGANGGAGEFGMINYLDHNFEYYSSGSFFKNKYNLSGEAVFENAKAGDSHCIKLYEEMGSHLGNAIKMILYALDVELIVIGGSVRQASHFFFKSMWKEIKTFEFQKARENIRIEISELENAGILGAAALHFDFAKKQH